MSNLRDLVAKLRLDTTQFNAGVRSTSQTLKAVGAMMAAASLAFGTALSAAAIKGANDIDKVAKSARRVESSIGGFRALEMAAGEAGVGVDTLADSVQTMDREIAKGSKSAAASLRTIGLEAKDLAGLEADQKLALVADGIKKMGLSSGQASAVLQGLGIRNKEMLLAVMSGGDVFRNARSDVESYGLALSSVQSDKIEAANDAIGRLSLIGTYFGQQLALAIVPALGSMAQALTDSLREGGLLRTVIDGLVGNLDVIAASIAVATTGFGVYYVGALALAKLATITFTGTLIALRTALITTGIGALVVAAGYLVAKFAELVSGAGGFGNAMSLLKDVAVEVWDRIRRGASLMAEAIAGSAMSINAAFAGAFAGVVESFASMTSIIAEGWNGLMGMMGVESNAQGMGSGLAASMRAEANMLASNAQAFNASIAESFSEITGPLESISALQDAVKTSADEATTALDGTANAAEGVGNAVEGAGGKGAAAAAKVKEAVDKVAQAADKGADRLGNMFASLLDGSKSVKSAIKDLIMEFAKMQLMKGFRSLFGAGGPLSGIGAALGLSLNANGNVFSGGRIQAFAKGGVVAGATAFAMQGGLGVMGEAGPEAIMPLSRGADGKLGVKSAGGGSLSVTVTMDPSTGALGAFVRDQAGRVVAQAAPAIAGAAVQKVVSMGREDRIF